MTMDPSIARDPAGNEAAACIKAAVRARLLALRAALPGRADAEARLAARLAKYLAIHAPDCVGFYWPFQGEFDARATVAAWLAAVSHRGAALPVVVDSRGPLAFHAWTPGCDMRTGRYGIAVPRDARAVTPDLLLIPCVGFNRARYRLGYGGGFYDRTLAALSPRPHAVGIAFAATETAELPVLPHDIPLDAILTESETI